MVTVVDYGYEYEEFARWFDEQENYGLRSERFFAMLDNYTDKTERNRLVRLWMTAAFDAGRHPEYKYV